MLQLGVDEAIRRELAGVSEDVAGRELTTEQTPGEVVQALADRRDELDAIGPDMEIFVAPDVLGNDLTGQVQRQREITLDAVIAAAISRNLNLQLARLETAISAEDVIAAEAVFDVLLFGGVNVTKTDQPSVVPVINGVPVGTGFNASQRNRFETGLSKRFQSGGSASISTDLTRSANDTSAISLSPDPAYISAARLRLTQPLLRNAGTDVNTASIRLAENAEDSAIEQFRSDLLGVLDDAEQRYWDLALAWHNLTISQWLVEVGVEVRDVLERRREFDTKPAQFSDAVATVERRKGDVLIARRLIRTASDRLKTLMNDPDVSLGDEQLLRPADAFIESPLQYNLRDALMTGMTRRPEIQQAILAIDDAAIRQRVAENLRKPLLDFSAEMAFFGLEDDGGSSYDELGNGDFIDYFVGVVFEVPLGNRAAEANVRRARLQRSAAYLGFRRAVQQVVLEVKGALRDVITNYELIQARRSFRVAQAENLRALLVEEETLAGLTPEFLNLKFNRQDGLAQARLQEVQALADFDQAVAALYRAMGIGLDMKDIEFEVGNPHDQPDVGGFR